MMCNAQNGFRNNGKLFVYLFLDSGAELFAKRRKRSEKWIVDETSRSASNPAATSYSAGPTQIYDTNQFNQSSYHSTDNQVCIIWWSFFVHVCHKMID